ncbi:olfactory receptor 10G4-like [Danio rerio]|uniref:Olfactory receptor 10G4-like n=1 Tax=Danio rerio TaxID=7955 RepID=A0AC58GN51_DANRE
MRVRAIGGYYSCISRTYFFNLGDLTECMALTLMALDRLIAISLPLRYHSFVTNSRILWLIFLTWILSFALIGFLTYVADTLPYCQPIIKYVFCSYSSLVRAACVDPEPYFAISTVYSMVTLCGPFPFILCTYAVLAYSVTKLANSSRKQMINTCLSHIIVLFSFYLPKIVYILLTKIGVVLTLTERYAVLIVSCFVSLLVNPTVYCIRTKEIRRKITDIFLYTQKITK